MMLKRKGVCLFTSCSKGEVLEIYQISAQSTALQFFSSHSFFFIFGGPEGWGGWDGERASKTERERKGVKEGEREGGERERERG